ncbi:DDE-type integrase/transposase/recombinase [Duganella sp. FT92W]|uniref:DDE-type integrase/transposase/recombinase n=1 Tax=Pseudoduganella rivuli TaxID=2666085 RepID=A0A7X2IJ75_9BURK|nr:DDE-type integrase/transposase/recombinase [Pseudoduganella rivuli]MRV70693.1 DDE-type integrase/transposase/recombinase [Pseudoduganella rivuli]
MGPLMHNQTIHILTGELDGLYRVVLNEVAANCTVLVRLDRASEPASSFGPVEGGQPPQKRKGPTPLCGQLLWLETTTLDQLIESNSLRFVELERRNFKVSPASVNRFEVRRRIMADFLKFDVLRTSILQHHTLGPLVTKTTAEHNVSRYLVYKCWSLLCRYGFSAESLAGRFDLCGAPGEVRDCSPDMRKKAGRKTNMQRMAQRTGQPYVEVQPGMNAVWRQRILMADKKIRSPKPKFPRRYQEILAHGFTTHFQEEDGVAHPMPLKLGDYPNKTQVRRVLYVEIPKLQRLQQMTTLGHFKRSLRGMVGRSWKGVAGPGHTWAIDSTIGDIYLRSSINRAWIIGRPIVYTVVDVWSTAIVGFYVCLAGPSWDTAKVSLYSAITAPDLLGELWGYEVMPSLYPHPCLPAVVLWDRGEYISLAAKETAYHLIERASFTPPYRPDLKGIVEVQHRITKDHQSWIPGAIDARRAEYELRKFDPNAGVFTLSEYANYLHNIYTEYNLIANREKRLDTDMIAAGVVPSPAGLWRWGHAVGIGMSRHFSHSELVRKLLPEKHATVTREGINFQNLFYASEESKAAQWTAEARNFNSWRIPAYHFPGSVSRIWTPNMGGAGLWELQLSEQANATRTQTYEEVEDAFAYSKLSHPETEHDRTQTKMRLHHKNNELVNNAKAMTAEALRQANGPMPSLSESRKMEGQTHGGSEITSAVRTTASPPAVPATGNAPSRYTEIMKRIIDAKNR